ncbi:hypothetical protein TrRE_jg4887, partial [Triparma retinervis]
MCPAGSFNPTTSNELSQCSDCPSGKHGASPGATGNETDNCIACTPGKYSSNPRSTTCSDCTEGKYQDSSGQSLCSDCGSGQYSGSGLSACSDCSVGTFLTDAAAPDEASACTVCGSGKYTSSSASAECSTCDAGKFLADSGTDPSLHSSHALCLVCQSGTFSGESSGACSPCPAGSFLEDDGLDAALHTSSTNCTVCTTGKYSGSGSGSCSDCCSLGSFTDSSASTSCQTCAEGKTTMNLGGTAINTCVPEKRMWDFRDCTSGAPTVEGTGGDLQASPFNGPTCTVDGIHFDGVDDYIQIDDWEWGGATSIELYVKYDTFMSSSPILNFGNSSREGDGASVDNVILGNAGTSSAVNFEVHQGSDVKSITTSNYESSTWTHIVVTVSGTSAKVYKNGVLSEDTCISCPVGKSSASLAASALSDCLSCIGGTFAGGTGMSMCENCAPGTFSIDEADTCTTCGKGTWSDGNSASCEDCPEGKFVADDGTNPSAHATSAACAICSAGSYSESTGSSQCTQCEVGKYNGDGSSNSELHDSPEDCLECSSGTYSPTAGSSSCQQCEGGKFLSEEGGTACSSCSEGQYSGLGQTSCVPCVQGKYLVDSASSEDEVACEVCGPGTFAAEESSTSCTNCEAGTYLSDAVTATEKHDSSADCEVCNAGLFSDAGAGACTPCMAGKYLQDAATDTSLHSFSSACTICEAGTHSTSGSATCVHCPAGKHLSDPGVKVELHDSQEDCILCGDGSYSLPAATSCTSCSAGKYLKGNATSDHDSEEDCQSCPLGTYNGVTGKSECDLCPMGYYNDVEGTTLCKQCDKNHHTNLEGSVAYNECYGPPAALSTSILNANQHTGTIQLNMDQAGTGLCALKPAASSTSATPTLSYLEANGQHLEFQQNKAEDMHFSNLDSSTTFDIFCVFSSVVYSDGRMVTSNITKQGSLTTAIGYAAYAESTCARVVNNNNVTISLASRYNSGRAWVLFLENPVDTIPTGEEIKTIGEAVGKNLVVDSTGNSWLGESKEFCFGGKVGDIPVESGLDSFVVAHTQVNLRPLTTYNIFIHTEDFEVPAEALPPSYLVSDFPRNVTTSCCGFITVESQPMPSDSALSFQSYRAMGTDSSPISFELSNLPSKDTEVVVSAKFYALSSSADTSDCSTGMVGDKESEGLVENLDASEIIFPHKFNFAPGSSSSLSGSFVGHFKKAGCVILTLTATGEAAEEFGSLESQLSNNRVAVNVIRDDAEPTPPSLERATFSNTVTSLFVEFNSATDKGTKNLPSTTSSFQCSQIFNIPSCPSEAFIDTVNEEIQTVISPSLAEDSVASLADFNRFLTLEVPNSLLVQDSTYSFTLSLTNFFHNSESSTIHVTVDSNSVPTISIEGGNVRSVLRPAALSIFAVAFGASCPGEPPKIVPGSNYAWTIFNVDNEEAVVDAPSTSVDKRYFKLDPYTLAPSSSYRVEVTATDSVGLKASASVVVNVGVSELVAVIDGGSKVVSPKTTGVKLSAASSFDPDSWQQSSTSEQTYSWSCVETSPAYGSPCSIDMNSAGTDLHFTESGMIGILDGTKAKTLAFSVTYSQGSRLSTASSFLIIESAEPPVVEIDPFITPKVNPSSKLQIKGFLAPDSRYPVNARWELGAEVNFNTGEGGTSTSLSEVASSSIEAMLQVAQDDFSDKQQFFLILPANTLVGGLTYAFRLNAAFDNPSAAAASSGGFAELIITVNSPPVVGLLQVDNGDGGNTGDALQTLFSLTAFDFSDDVADLPLRYSYLYTIGRRKLGAAEVLISANLLSSQISDIILPSGAGNTSVVEVFTRVSDVYGASSEAFAEAYVKTPKISSQELANLTDSLTSAALEKGDTSTVFQVIASSTSILNSLNCSLVPNCAPLNREECSEGETPNTCGRCLEGFVSNDNFRKEKCEPPAEQCSNGVKDKGETDVDCGWPRCKACSSGHNCLSSRDCSFGLCKEGICSVPQKRCPGDCSGNGICFAYDSNLKVIERSACVESSVACRTSCTCNKGSLGKSCDKTEEEQLQLIDQRKNMLQTLEKVLEIQDLSPEAASQQASSLESLVSNAEELDDEARSTASTIMTTVSEGLLQSGGVDTNTAKSLGESVKKRQKRKTGGLSTQLSEMEDDVEEEFEEENPMRKNEPSVGDGTKLRKRDIVKGQLANLEIGGVVSDKLMKMKNRRKLKDKVKATMKKILENADEKYANLKRRVKELDEEVAQGAVSNRLEEINTELEHVLNAKEKVKKMFRVRGIFAKIFGYDSKTKILAKVSRDLKIAQAIEEDIELLNESNKELRLLEHARMMHLSLFEQKIYLRNMLEFDDDEMMKIHWAKKVFGYAFVGLYLLATSFYICLFGITMGNDMTKSWLTSFLMADLTDILWFIPLKILLVNIYLPTLIGKHVSQSTSTLTKTKHWYGSLVNENATVYVAQNHPELEASQLVIEAFASAVESKKITQDTKRLREGEEGRVAKQIGPMKREGGADLGRSKSTKARRSIWNPGLVSRERIDSTSFMLEEVDENDFKYKGLRKIGVILFYTFVMMPSAVQDFLMDFVIPLLSGSVVYGNVLIYESRSEQGNNLPGLIEIGLILIFVTLYCVIRKLRKRRRHRKRLKKALQQNTQQAAEIEMGDTSTRQKRALTIEQIATLGNEVKSKHAMKSVLKSSTEKRANKASRRTTIKSRVSRTTEHKAAVIISRKWKSYKRGGSRLGSKKAKSMWVAVWDETYKMHYYQHKETGQSKWEAPEENAEDSKKPKLKTTLRGGKTGGKDTSKPRKRKVKSNEETGRSHQSHDVRENLDQTREKQQAPSQWQMLVDPSSQKVYYHNSETNETTWEKPALETNPKKAWKGTIFGVQNPGGEPTGMMGNEESESLEKISKDPVKKESKEHPLLKVKTKG